ncbi:hypothetical protein [Massilia sp. Dwa41.01b]|uniref:hypothetical protein n=1 Tax=Massilia sp. Dwa41.01b TaxID=2709302 RepID=UPI001E305A6F|nr:hypothetical protein [Massilia sp. Dwa41.01b]
MRFQLGARAYRVREAGTGHLLLSDAAHTWRYDGVLLQRDGAALPPCPDAGAGARLFSVWRRIAPSALAPARPVTFGGSLDCGNRIGNPDVDTGGAAIVLEDGDPVLLAGAARLPLLVDAAGLPRELALVDFPLAGVTALRVGRTRLSVAVLGDRLHLEPAGKLVLRTAPRAELPAGVSWQWTRRDPGPCPRRPPGGQAWPLPAACSPPCSPGADKAARTRPRRWASAPASCWPSSGSGCCWPGAWAPRRVPHGRCWPPALRWPASWPGAGAAG